MNIEGTNVNPNPDDLPKRDQVADQILTNEKNLEMLYEVQNKKIKITNQKDKDNIEQTIKDLQEQLETPVWSSGMIRSGAEMATFHEYKAELRGRIAVYKDLVKSDVDLKEQIADTEKALNNLRKKAE